MLHIDTRNKVYNITLNALHNYIVLLHVELVSMSKF